MSEDRKRSSAGFWALAIALLPVLYVGSFGPYIWLANQGFLPSAATAVYEPLTATVAAAPEFVQDWHYAYIDLWLPAAIRDAPVPIHTVTPPGEAAVGADSAATAAPPE